MPEQKPYPGIKQAWVLMFILLGIDLLVGLVLELSFFGANFDSRANQAAHPALSNINDFLSYTIAGILGFIVAYKKRKSSGITSAIGLKRVPFYIYISSIIMVLCIGYIDEIVVYLIPIPDSILELFNSMNQKSILIFATAVLSAPILEELVFRGIILDGLLKNTSPVKAILISALIFAVIHGNPWQGITAFLFGILGGWLYWKTSSLILCIVLHATNNFISTLFGWFYTGDAQTPLIDTIGLVNYLLIFIAIIPVFIFCLRYVDKYLKKQQIKITTDT